MKKCIVLLIWVLSFFSCSKKDEVSNPKRFYQEPRNVLLSERFDQGVKSMEIDNENYQVLSQTAFLQNGPCSNSSPGFFDLGCVPPLDLTDSIELARQYELAFVDTLYHFKSIYSLAHISTDELRLQIEYAKGGQTEIYFKEYSLKGGPEFLNLDQESLHILINSIEGKYQAYLGDKEVSDLYQFDSLNNGESKLVFKVENRIEMNAGVPFVQINGMSINRFDVYSN